MYDMSQIKEYLKSNFIEYFGYIHICRKLSLYSLREIALGFTGNALTLIFYSELFLMIFQKYNSLVTKTSLEEESSLLIKELQDNPDKDISTILSYILIEQIFDETFELLDSYTYFNIFINGVINIFLQYFPLISYERKVLEDFHCISSLDERMTGNTLDPLGVMSELPVYLQDIFESCDIDSFSVITSSKYIDKLVACGMWKLS